MGEDTNELYSRSAVGTVAWNHDVDSVVLQWNDFAKDGDFRERMDESLELLEAVGGNKMIADAREQGAIADEDQQWSVVDWAPRAEEAGLEYLVILYPEQVVAQMSVDNVIEEVQQIDDPIERQIVDSIPDCWEWLHDQPSAATDVPVPTRERPTAREPAAETAGAESTAADAEGSQGGRGEPATPGAEVDSPTAPAGSPGADDASSASPETDVPKVDGSAEPAFVEANESTTDPGNTTSTKGSVDPNASFGAFVGGTVAAIAAIVAGLLGVPVLNFQSNIVAALAVLLVFCGVGAVAGWSFVEYRNE